jgi:hypothetical protein
MRPQDHVVLIAGAGDAFAADDVRCTRKRDGDACMASRDAALARLKMLLSVGTS